MAKERHSHSQSSFGDVLKKRFYITTPIYYASGKPHLGHAFTSIAADVLARWNRNIGKEVFFQTGTDEHGQKIVEKACEIKKDPKTFVDLMAPQFQNLMKKLNISYDYFIRTTDEDHKKYVQEFLQKSYDNGDIYLGEYEGLYCVGCEAYYTQDELIDGKFCPIHKTQAEKVKEENYFFKLSKYEDKLLKIYEENNFLIPQSRAKETINRVKEGLQDISISRNKEKLGWGIELPFDKNHVTYVWFDALFNYITGLKINNKDNFWPCDVHMIGKDIKWFHEVYWPAFLMSVGMQMPKNTFSHGFILDKDGHKMSKSLGNVIDPIKFSKKYGVDEFRYFLIAGGSFGEDINFDLEVFVQKINNELNNDLGNLVSRVHAMTQKYFGGLVPGEENLTQDEIELIAKLNIFKPFNQAMQNLEFNKANNILFTAIRDTNAYINKVAPWKEEDMKRLSAIINTLNFAIKTFADYIDCFMPDKAQRIRKQYNFGKGDFSEFKSVKAGHKLGEKDNLFEKIKLEKKEDKPKEREGFEKLNLKAAKIVKVEKHPDSQKLYILQVDLGNEKRQIVSGLQEIYEEKDLQDRMVIVISNLKPAKLGGYESNGMVLACEDPDIGHDDCGLLTTTLKVGTQILAGDLIADNESIIKSKIFQKTQMTGKDNKVFFEGKELKGVGIDKGFKGKIC